MEEVLIAPFYVSLLLATSAVDVPPTVGVEDCPAAAQPLPASLSGWARPTPVSAGADAASAATLTIGESVRATLQPITKIAFAAEPEKASVAGSYGGLFAVVVPAKARYRVALGSSGWIDVLARSTPVATAAHSHGPACSGIRKLVDFDLAPGRYVVQVSGSDAVAVPIMIARVP